MVILWVIATSLIYTYDKSVNKYLLSAISELNQV